MRPGTFRHGCKAEVTEDGDRYRTVPGYRRKQDIVNSLDSEEALKRKRVTVDDNEGTVRAPTSFFGRIVDWIKGK